MITMISPRNLYYRQSLGLNQINKDSNHTQNSGTVIVGCIQKQEYELFFTKNIAILHKFGKKDSKHVMTCKLNEDIKFGIFACMHTKCTTNDSLATNIEEADTSEANGVMLFTERTAKFYQFNSSMRSCELPCRVSGVWKMRNLILMERGPMRHPAEDVVPSLFVLTHPLAEMTPVVHCGRQFVHDIDFRILAVCERELLLLAYHRGSRLFSLWQLRDAHKKDFDSLYHQNWDGTVTMRPNISSKMNQTLDEEISMGDNAECSSSTPVTSLKKTFVSLGARSPMVKALLATKAIEGSEQLSYSYDYSFQKQQNKIGSVEPLFPQICLQQLFSFKLPDPETPTFGTPQQTFGEEKKKEVGGVLPHGMLVQDWLGQRSVCVLADGRLHTLGIRVAATVTRDRSRDAVMAASAAVFVPGSHLLAVVEPRSRFLGLWAGGGLVPISKVSLAAGCGLHIEQEQQLLVGLSEPAHNALTLQLADGTARRLYLPDLARSGLVRRCLLAVAAVPISSSRLTLLARWFCLNRAVDTDEARSHEWTRLQAFLMTELGYRLREDDLGVGRLSLGIEDDLARKRLKRDHDHDDLNTEAELMPDNSEAQLVRYGAHSREQGSLSSDTMALSVLQALHLVFEAETVAHEAPLCLGRLLGSLAASLGLPLYRELYMRHCGPCPHLPVVATSWGDGTSWAAPPRWLQHTGQYPVQARVNDHLGLLPVLQLQTGPSRSDTEAQARLMEPLIHRHQQAQSECRGDSEARDRSARHRLQAYWDRVVRAPRAQPCSPISETAHSLLLQLDSHPALQLLHPDRRLLEAYRLLQSSCPLALPAPSANLLPDAARAQLNERLRFVSHSRTLALGPGRGMLGLAVARSLPGHGTSGGQLLTVPPLCLQGRSSTSQRDNQQQPPPPSEHGPSTAAATTATGSVGPAGATGTNGSSATSASTSSQLIDLPTAAAASTSAWPAFHNGAATGLTLSPSVVADPVWVLRHCAQTASQPGRLELTPQQAGLMFGLALNGHLSRLSADTVGRALKSGSDMTVMAFLLGLSAHKMGTQDSRLMKYVSLYYSRLIPAERIVVAQRNGPLSDLSLGDPLQPCSGGPGSGGGLCRVAAVMATGLLQFGSGKLTTARTLLLELGADASTLAGADHLCSGGGGGSAGGNQANQGAPAASAANQIASPAELEVCTSTVAGLAVGLVMFRRGPELLAGQTEPPELARLMRYLEAGPRFPDDGDFTRPRDCIEGVRGLPFYIGSGGGGVDEGAALRRVQISGRPTPDQLSRAGLEMPGIAEARGKHIVRTQDSHYNMDATGPAAAAALALMFLATGNEAVAARLRCPSSLPLLDRVRPPLLALRQAARGLILWDRVVPTHSWLLGEDGAVPSLVQDQHCFLPRRRHQHAPPLAERAALNEAHLQLLAGGAFALGLRYAGTDDAAARDLLISQIRRVLQLWKLHGPQPGCGGGVSPECDASLFSWSLSVLLLAACCVSAGSGNLELLRLSRHLRSVVHQPQPQSTEEHNYGVHCAYGMALGLLFLGGGRLTLSNSPRAAAVLIVALFPRFPAAASGSRYHLQALRHLYVLATRPRVLCAVDMDSRLAVSVQSIVRFQNGKERQQEGFVLYPAENAKLIKEIEVFDQHNRYLPQLYKPNTRAWDILLASLFSGAYFFVKTKDTEPSDFESLEDVRVPELCSGFAVEKVRAMLDSAESALDNNSTRSLEAMTVHMRFLDFFLDHRQELSRLARLVCSLDTGNETAVAGLLQELYCGGCTPANLWTVFSGYLGLSLVTLRQHLSSPEPTSLNSDSGHLLRQILDY